MAASYWIKLYHEILNDPKMGRLDDRLWRRAIEVFLLAGEAGEDGYLPSVEDMSWVLRCEAGALQADLELLADRAGIVELRDGRWYVVKFAERQAALPAAERKARQRSRVTKRAYSGHEDVTNRDTDIDIDKEREEEEEEDAEAEVVDAPSPGSYPEAILQYHHTVTGVGLNAAQATALVSGAGQLGPEKVRKAIKEWVSRGHKPWNVEGILDVARHGWRPAGAGGARAPAAARDGSEYLTGKFAEIIKH